MSMASPFFGKFSEIAGITIDQILNSQQNLLEDVKIGLIFEMRQILKSDSECSQRLLILSGKDKTQFDLNHLRIRIFRIMEKVKKEKTKHKFKELATYLETNFDINLSLSKADHLSDMIKIEKENRNLKRQIQETEESYRQSLSDINLIKESFSEMIIEYESEISDLENRETLASQSAQNHLAEISNMEKINSRQAKRIDSMINDLIKAKDKLNKASISKKNLNKKLKLKRNLDESFDTAYEHLPSQDSEELSAAPLKTQDDFKKIQNEVYYLRKKVKKLEEEKSLIANTLEATSDQYLIEIKSLKEQIKELEKEKIFLEKDIIQTFEDNRYTDNVRSCCLELVTKCNVSMNNVHPAILSVLKNFTNVKPERLPSKSLLSRCLIPEGKVIACKQIAEKMLENFDPSDNFGNVLHQDATTKFSEHYEGMQVTLKSGDNLSIGLAKVGGGSANDYVGVFENIMNDLSMAYSGQISCSEDDRGKLITSLKSFLSDQCATNPVFNRAIEDMRSKLLPGLIPNFENLSISEQERISQMGQFACRLHLLANFGTAADKALKLFEESICSGKNPYAFGEDSGTFRLAKTSAKALTKRGSDQSGIGAFWESYLDSLGKKNLLITFHGHRINLVFYNCAAVYHHKDDIVGILTDFDKPNKLLCAVLFDVKEKAYLAGARAMGIFYELVTAPFWLLLEQSGSILDLNQDLLHMKLTLSQWAKDGLEPLNGSPMFPQIMEKSSQRFHESLFAVTNDEELELYTQIALELLSSQLLIILERQAASQLPKGKYFEPSEDLKQVASNVSKTNAISERDMAILDNLLRAKPAASSLCLETMLLWTRNKPSIWLDSLSDTERERLMTDARKLGPQFRKLFTERQKQVKDQVSKRLLEKKTKKVQDDQIKMNNKLDLTNEIAKLGGPWCNETIGEKVESIIRVSTNPEKSVREALLSQIKFHRTVLGSSGPKELFQESVKKRKYTNEELIGNLQQILSLNFGSSSSSKTSTESLSYHTISEIQDHVQSKKEALYTKLASERQQRQINQVKELLPQYRQNPQLLVGKRVSHKCLEAGKAVQWYSGEVIGIKSLKTDVIKSEYNIRYDDNPDDEWFFPLLMDLKKGDLIIY